MKAEKCKYHKQDLKYFRLIVGKDVVKIDPEKVATVMAWESLEYTFNVW